MQKSKIQTVGKRKTEFFQLFHFRNFLIFHIWVFFRKCAEHSFKHRVRLIKDLCREVNSVASRWVGEVSPTLSSELAKIPWVWKKCNDYIHLWVKSVSAERFFRMFQIKCLSNFKKLLLSK